jgi:hypothetical protein
MITRAFIDLLNIDTKFSAKSLLAESTLLPSMVIWPLISFVMAGLDVARR